VHGRWLKACLLADCYLGHAVQSSLL
jgi:hypothetical protein